MSGHLRHPLGRHEGGRLDRRHACVLQPLDQLDLHRRGHAPRLVLQAVARRDVDDPDLSWQAHARRLYFFFFARAEGFAASSQPGTRFSRNERTPSLPSSDARAVAMRTAMSASRSGAIGRFATAWIKSLVTACAPGAPWTSSPRIAFTVASSSSGCAISWMKPMR